MAFVLLEGFDHYSSAVVGSQMAMKGWGGTAEGNHAGRFPYGPQSLSVTAAIIDDSINKNLPANYTELYAGFGFWVDQLANVQIFNISGCGGIGITNTGFVTLINRLGNVVGTGTHHFFAKNWNYVEVHLAQTTGAIQLNGLSEIASTASDFSGTYNNVAFSYQVLGGVGLQVDDMYVSDTTGGVNNTWAGDIVVETLYPINDGTYKQWTPDTGSTHYTRVNEYIIDGDSSYVHTTGAGNKDSYGMGSPTLAATPVLGVQVNLGVRKNDAGTRIVEPLIRQAGTDYTGNSQAVTAAYQFLSQIYNQDPTGSNWTYSNVNSDEFGIELVS